MFLRNTAGGQPWEKKESLSTQFFRGCKKKQQLRRKRFESGRRDGVQKSHSKVGYS